ncbi:response regulator transcription factor [Devosia elaeis]|uniref:Two-component system response regulator n=1 Tax=Devosia elaeis TaxID=1770058 RepID=A0A178I5L4_9HYPH|nr:response regulator transcription factor [Devosia elaeis]OAM79677.1 two-component system response regulator [Devosia elaeis]
MAVLIAEDDQLHRVFARRILGEIWSDDGEVYEAANRQEAIRLAQTHEVRRAILDLQLPDGSGVDVARALWARRQDTQVLFWSNFADEAYVRSLGRIVPDRASYGYLLKSASEQEMRAALEAVFFKDRRVLDREVRIVQDRISNRLGGLSDTEYEGLIDIALGLTDKIIAQRRRLSLRGVQNRLRHLYEKLEIPAGETSHPPRYNSRTRAVTVALERGLINLDVLTREQEFLDTWLRRRKV